MEMNMRERREQLARYQWESSPLPASRKRALLASARYMAQTLQGQRVDPPADWPPDWIAAWQAVLASPPDRAAAMRWMLDGAAALERAYAADAEIGDGG